MDIQKRPQTDDLIIPEFLSGGGEMGKIIRSKDWSTTPLGSPDIWPQSLRTTVSLCIASNFPIAIAWGKDRVQIYNDGYWPITGDKHPTSMGQDFKECWFSAWPVIGQAFEEASLGQTRFLENQRMFLDRYGYLEETFFTFSFSPILDESGGVGGLFHPVTELTQQTLAERRLNILRAVADNTVNAKTEAEASALILECLKDFELDLPFVLLYSIAANGKAANLEGSVGVKSDSPLTPTKVDLEVQQSNSWPFTEVLQKGTAVPVEDLSNTFGAFQCGPYPEPPKQALIFPVNLHGTAHNNYFLVTGVSSRRSLDEKYRVFFDLLTASINNALTKARAQDEERKKAEALAEIDKAKTVFFSNISHEFRTPLTLMLGSLEELLDKRTGEIAVSDKEAIETSHRNAMRLLRLVNNLLDFSRIEAGRVQAQYQLTDLAKYTTDLASNFRSVMENAGLIFQVKTEVIIQPVYIDKEMWEKIVLNLLSNAFKYTLRGSITLSLTTENNQVLLKVADTGVGIPEAELPKMFQRFHRVQNVVGRTYEGTGIGLSLVSELVKLHGGEIKVESKVAEGSVFTVSIPTGKAHLPTEHVFEKELDPMAIGLTASLSGAFIEEATTLIDHAVLTGNGPEALEVNTDTPTVLVVDDNADMRAYIKNLLQKQYHVVTANNGMEALDQIKHHAPQLILSDIMMPVMDGIGLMKTVKENVETQNIPVILLSARAGEESKIEGYETGADDYLVKPFSAKELVARVASQLKTSNVRKKIQQQLQNIITQAPVAMCVLRGPTYIVEVANERVLELWGKTSEQMMNKPVFEAMPDAAGQGFEDLLNNVYKTGIPFIANEMPIDLIRKGKLERAYLNFVYEPLYDADEKISGIVAVATEMTEQVIASKKIEESEHKFRIAIEGGGLGTYDFYPQTGELSWSEKTKEFFGLPPEAEVDYSIFLKGLHPDDRERSEGAIQKAMEPNSEGLYENEYRTVGITDGKLRWIKSKGKVNFDVGGRPIRFTGVTQDITEQKETLASLQVQSLVLQRMDEGVSVSDEDGLIVLTNPAEDKMFGYATGELMGKNVTIQNAYPPEENEKIVAGVIEQLKSKGLWSGEWHNRKKDGTEFYTFSYITSISIDDKTRFVCVQRDVTEEKLAKEMLAYRTAILEAQNEAIPDAILIVDTKGNMLSFNQHFVELWNIPKDIVERKDDTAALQFAMAQLVDPQGFIDRVNYCYAHPNERAQEEVLFKDGRIIERYGNVVNGEDGTNYGWAWYFRDITERKKVEQDLINTKEQLELTFKNIPAGVYLINHKGEMIYVNEKGASIYGDLVPQDLLDIKDLPSLLKKADELFERFDEDGNYFAAQNSPAFISLTTGLASQAVMLQINRDTRESSWYYIQGAPLLTEEGKVSMVLVTSTDITLQKKSEQAIRQSEENFRQLADLVPQIIWTSKPDGSLDYYNKRWYDYTGFEEDYGDQSWLPILHPDDVQLCIDTWNHSVQSGEAYAIEYRFKDRINGGFRWFLGKALPIKDKEGNILKWFGTCTDINDQKSFTKELENKVKERTEQLQLQNHTFELAESIAQFGSYSWSITNDTLEYSDNLFRLLDCEPQEFVPSFEKFLSFIHPDDLQQVIENEEQTAKTGALVETPYRIISKTGKTKWFRSSGSFSGEGASRLLIGTVQDISKDVVAAEALIEKEDYLNQIINNAPDAVIVVNEKNIITLWNPKTEEIFGWKAEEVLGLNLSDTIIPTQYREGHREGMKRLLKTGEPRILNKPLELAALNKEGKEFPISLTVSQAVQQGDKLYISFIRDITLEKQTKDLAISNQSLLKANMELEASQKASEELLKQRDEFISIASHEMKTPLTTAKGYTELLLLSLGAENQSVLYATKANQAIDRLNDLISELLDASKIQNGQLDYNITTFDFNEMVDEAIEDIQLTTKNHSLQKSGNCSQQITGDRDRLKQVMFNLLNNAVKYSPNGENVFIKVEGQVGNIQVSVQDFGVGMLSQHLDKVFERYYRVQEHAHHIQGLGIGLHISRNIIQRHEGKMWAESELDKGSIFYFTLPL